MFVCCGQVINRFIILKQAIWLPHRDPTLQQCADWAVSQKKPAKIFADTASNTGNGWLQQEKAAFAGQTQEAAKRMATYSQKLLYCIICEPLGKIIIKQIFP